MTGTTTTIPAGGPPRPPADPAQQPTAQYDIAAEQVVLGAMLTTTTAIDDATDTLGPDDFYRPIHATIYQAITRAYTNGQPTDAVAITSDLVASGDIDRIGGAPYLHTCIAAVPVTANTAWYATKIAEHAGFRRLATAGATITQIGTSPGQTLAEARERAGTALHAAITGRDTHDPIRAGDLLDATLKAIEDAPNTPGGLRGLTTGYLDLDMLTHGLQPGQLIVIAGRPGLGKSTAALNILANAAIREQHPGAIFSLEMSREQIMNALLAADARVSHHGILTGNLSDDDWSRLARSAARIAEAPLYIDDTANLGLLEIRAKARRLKQRHDIKLVVVDYLQLMASPARAENRQQAVADFSRGLKLLAKEIECPVIALSQLNRGPEGRNDKRPQLADLRESGAIEQDADIVIMIHRDDYYDKESPRAGEADLIVAKNRGGATDTVTVAAQLHIARFSDLAPAAMS